ncbi:carboxylate--amine ligase, partial [Streptomyces sp. NPDC059956]
YPTVEVRGLDVQLRAEDAVLLAGMVRALVATAIAEEKAGMPPAPAADSELLQASSWHAARYGLNGTLIGPDGRPGSSGDVLCSLVRHVTPALETAGDLREVSALVHRLLQEGTPADRQRRAVSDGGLPALIGLITSAGQSD